MAKKRLSQEQEFQVMKLVLDKFLWVGTGLMVFGIWQMFMNDLAIGLGWTAAGAIVFILFMVIIIKEYEIIK